MIQKNTTKFLVLLGLMLIWLPTGITDFWLIPLIISKVGFEMYILISVLMVWYLYKTIDGKTIGDKIQTVQREVKIFLRKL